MAEAGVNQSIVKTKHSKAVPGRPKLRVEQKGARLGQLEIMLGYHFEQPRLLVQALTHSSVPYEKSAAQDKCTSADSPTEGEGRENHNRSSKDPDKILNKPINILTEHNEQLEFLGDAVVGLLVAESLLRRYPELHEGELTRLRAALVSRRHLGVVGAELDLATHLRVSREMERNGGRTKGSLVANCMEAVLGAMFLDGGLEPARSLVERAVVEPYALALREELEQGGTIGDYKSALQDYLRSQKHGAPEYVVKAESGPDHRKRFTVEVRVQGQSEPSLARGHGTTKKKAEQEAARGALQKMQGRGHASGEAQAD